MAADEAAAEGRAFLRAGCFGLASAARRVSGGKNALKPTIRSAWPAKSRDTCSITLVVEISCDLNSFITSRKLLYTLGELANRRFTSFRYSMASFS